VDGGLHVILPTHDPLRCLAFDDHSFFQRQLAQRIAGKSTRETLTRKVRRAAKRISNSDVAFLIDRRTGHPTIETLRREGSLLIQSEAAIFSNSKFVPAHTAAAS